MIEEKANVSERHSVGLLVFDVVDVDLNAPVYCFMPVVEEEWILSIVFNAANALWLTLRVVVIMGFEILIVFLLVVRDIPSGRHDNQWGHCCLKDGRLSCEKQGVHHFDFRFIIMN